VVAALGGEERPGQIAMAEAVAASLDNNEHLLIEAGTGTGKSVGYIVPSLLQGKRVVVATATIALQRQLVHRDLPRIADALKPVLGRRPTFAVLKGRHNFLCLERLNRALPDDSPEPALFDSPTTKLGKQAAFLRTWADETETGDRDDIEDPIDARVWRSVSVSGRECVGALRCPFGDECFAERSKALAFASDIVITNHAVLAIDALDNVPLLPDHAAVIVDEGHELVDRATTAVTLEINAQMVERAATMTRRLAGTEISDRLNDAADDLGRALIHIVSNDPIRLPAMPDALIVSLAGVRDAAHRVLTTLTQLPQTDDAGEVAVRARAKAVATEVHDGAGRFISSSANNDVVWVSGVQVPTLYLAPLSVSGLLRKSLFERTPVVITSATLQVGGGFAAMARSLGLTSGGRAPDAPVEPFEPSDEQGADASRWTALDVGSPFDFSKQAILYVAAHLPRPIPGGPAPEALAELIDLVAAAGGRTLALFSSWKGVEVAEEALTGAGLDNPDAPLLVQRKGEPPGPLVKRFAAEPASTLIGTMSLWQGVDVPGDTCTLVVIDKIPFPRPDDPVTAARSEAVDRSGGSGFASVSVPRASLLLAQGAGRLIRSTSDRGVVAVLDPRLVTAGYAGLLRAGLPAFWMTTDAAIVKESLRRLDEAAKAHLANGIGVATDDATVTASD
jgi:ATP-dependent DNA helicase DinG